MADIDQWSKTAASNSSVSPDGAQTGWSGSSVGPWARETMASVRRWFDAPDWISFLKDEPTTGDKTVAYAGASSFTISGVTDVADSAGYSLTDKLPVNQKIRLITAGGAITEHFITSTNLVSTTLTVNVSGNDVTNTSYAANGMEVFMTGKTVLAPMAWGGSGTTTVRDTTFGSQPPAGVMWYDTDNNVTTISDGSAWGSMSGVVNSLTADPTMEFQEAGVMMSKIYYDITNNRLTVENGDWSAGSGTHGRVYINDTDGKLYHGLQTDAADTLNGNINASVTIIPVNSTAGFPDGGVVLIGSEQILYEVLDGNNLGTATHPCVRAYSSTVAATHSNGDSVAVQNSDLSLTPGAGNGLNADLLDGKHLKELLSYLLGTGNPGSDFWYPGRVGTTSTSRTATSDVFADGYLKLDNSGSPILIQWGTYTQMTAGGHATVYTSKSFPQAFSSVPFMFCPGTHTPYFSTSSAYGGQPDAIIAHYDDNSNVGNGYTNWGWYVTATDMHLFEDIGSGGSTPYDLGGWPFIAIGPA